MPEVYDVIMKYRMFSKFGWGHTLESFEREPFIEIQLMAICENYESKAQSTQKGGTTVVSRSNI